MNRAQRSRSTARRTSRSRSSRWTSSARAGAGRRPFRSPERTPAQWLFRSDASVKPRGPIYELEVALLDGNLSPVFLRRNRVVARNIEIRADQTLWDLHKSIFRAFNRWEEHMHEFQIGGKRLMDPKARCYVLPGEMKVPLEGKPYAGDVTQTTIGSLGLKVNEPFAYWFDYGRQHAGCAVGRLPVGLRGRAGSPPPAMQVEADLRCRPSRRPHAAEP